MSNISARFFTALLRSGNNQRASCLDSPTWLIRVVLARFPFSNKISLQEKKGYFNNTDAYPIKCYFKCGNLFFYLSSTSEVAENLPSAKNLRKLSYFRIEAGTQPSLHSLGLHQNLFSVCLINWTHLIEKLTIILKDQ